MEGEAWETLGNNPSKSGVFILIIPGQFYQGAVQAAHVDRQDYALVCQEDVDDDRRGISGMPLQGRLRPGSCEIILTVQAGDNCWAGS